VPKDTSIALQEVPLLTPQYLAGLVNASAVNWSLYNQSRCAAGGGRFSFEGSRVDGRRARATAPPAAPAPSRPAAAAAAPPRKVRIQPASW
jgi:hypothetical protein